MPPHNPDPEKLKVVEFQPDKGESGKRTLRLVRATELGEPKPADYVVKGLLNRGDLALIFGKAGSGKSLFAAHLFYRVAQGVDDAYGKRVRGGPVIYVCLEGQGGFRRRLQALEQAHGSAEDFYLVEEPFSLVDPEAADLIESLIKQAQEIRPAAIVIDTWAQATGGDENGSEANSRALAAINRLRAETGALVCCIDHTGWGEDAQKRPRGWSGKWAATDTGLRVDGDIKNGDVLIVPERLKDGTDYAPLAFGSERVELDIDQDGDPIEIYRGVERDADTRDQMQKAKKAKARALSPDDQLICDALKEFLADHGTTGWCAPANAHLTHAPRADAYRYLVEKEILTRPTLPDGQAMSQADPITDKETQAFKRKINRLKARGKMDQGDGFIWATPDADSGW